MKRTRFGVRTLLILVAVFAMASWLATEGGRRSARYFALASFHESRIVGGHGIDSLRFTYMPMSRDGKSVEGRQLALDLWHRDMWARYYRASMNPWKPLRPEPSFPVEGQQEFESIRGAIDP